MTAMLLEVDRISRRFGGLYALRDVCLNLEEGEIVGLIGPNGAGKTTLLNLVAGAHLPSGGEIRFGGNRVTGLPPDALCRLGISRTFQIANGFPRLSALENVAVAAAFGRDNRRRNAWKTAAEMLEFVSFPRTVDALAVNLSASELKRLDLARALAGHPRLLLLDEPFAGLSAREVLQLARLLQDILRKGVAILLVEHLMRVIMQECSRVVVLCSGEKIAEGSAQEIARHPHVIEAYLGTIHPFRADPERA